MLDIWPKGSAFKVLTNDQEVINTHNIKITENEMPQTDDASLNASRAIAEPSC
jgi:hypothetical protein